MSFFLNGRQAAAPRRSRCARASKGNFGVFRSRIRLREGGKYAASARHVANAGSAATAPIRKDWKVRYPVGLGAGECGRVVRGFKKALRRARLRRHGGSCFSGKTAPRRARLPQGQRHGPQPARRQGARQAGLRRQGRLPASATAAPASTSRCSLSKQVLVFAKGEQAGRDLPDLERRARDPDRAGPLQLLLYASRATTRVGMYYSTYFYGGYAIHGYHSVPNLPGEPRLRADLHLRPAARSTTGSSSARTSSSTDGHRRR